MKEKKNMPLCKYCRQKVTINDKQEYECKNCGKELKQNEIEYTKEESEQGLKRLRVPIIGSFIMSIIVYIVAPFINPYFQYVAIFIFILSIIMTILYFMLKKQNDNKPE